MEAIGTAGVGSVAKKAGLPLVVVLIAGIAGALASVAALGRGSYAVTPFMVDLSVTPAISGTTTLQMKAANLPNSWTVKQTTHSSPIAFGATVTGVDAAGLATAAVDTTRPDQVLRYIGEHDKSAVRAFALKVGGIALAGGFALSLLVALGNFKRAILGAVAGLIVLGVLAFVAKTTYSSTNIQSTRFSPAGVLQSP